jgi:glucose/mannose-6-phosphate isomerase
MELDELSKFHSLDALNLIGQLNSLPKQLADAWELGMSLRLPEINGIKGILIAGVGGSAIGADLLASYAAPLGIAPISVLRDYELPRWASGPQSLVIVCSHSGDTEEILAVYEQAQARDCHVLVITTGGRLAQLGRQKGIPVWQFAHSGAPCIAVGYFFGLLLAALYRLELIPDPTSDLHEALHAMRNQQTNLLPEVPVVFNPAKRMAGQLVGRWVVVFAADSFDVVARRWKVQINELAKAWAQFEFLPEADHNTLSGLNNPESMLVNTIALFLQASSNHPDNLLRLENTRQICMTQGINTDMILAKGENRLAHIWTLLHFGDYTSYYLAMAYGEDPTPVDIYTVFKNG